MKIKAPGLTTNMTLETLDVDGDRIVVRGRIGAYNATASAEAAELRLLLAKALRPRTIIHIVRLLVKR